MGSCRGVPTSLGMLGSHLIMTSLASACLLSLCSNTSFLMWKQRRCCPHPGGNIEKRRKVAGMREPCTCPQLYLHT
ncbi:hypothetical protein QBC47DRAFT_384217 [Echria macrotheca]|uniref:Uncharacterized protein n=1 Tax=Echria macrotheca TaxID=438768 RepID=A0AAJ0BA75_9PEZI|nr:hypothetical protein QBC47DRAFT_384217 [Echria macrotheca]